MVNGVNGVNDENCKNGENVRMVGMCEWRVAICVYSCGVLILSILNVNLPLQALPYRTR